MIDFDKEIIALAKAVESSIGTKDGSNDAMKYSQAVINLVQALYSYKEIDKYTTFCSTSTSA